VGTGFRKDHTQNKTWSGDDDSKKNHPALKRGAAAAVGARGAGIGAASMAKLFKVGDHVSWNSEAGRVRGRIVKVHTKNVDYKGYVHHASKDAPQYEIKSDKTDHVALHKGAALTRLRR
jgi:DUF2945 family protein